MLVIQMLLALRRAFLFLPSAEYHLDRYAYDRCKKNNKEEEQDLLFLAVLTGSTDNDQPPPKIITKVVVVTKGKLLVLRHGFWDRPFANAPSWKAMP
jgi:hypothetical protein